MQPTPETAPDPRAKPRRSSLQNILIVMLGTLGSRLTGVARQLLVNVFSPTLTDAFVVASRVPNLFRELLAEGALVNSFIPVYKGLDEVDRRRLANTFAGTLIAINLLLLGLGWWLAPWIVSFFVVGKPEVYATAVYMTRLVMPFLMLVSLSAVCMALLNADEHFRETSFAPIALNVAAIAVLLIFPKTATFLALGWTVGGLAQLLVQLPALGRFGLLPRPTLRWDPRISRVLLLMAPFALTTSSRQFLNLIVTRFLTANFAVGTLTGYGNAETLFQTAQGLFVVSPALALFPRLAAFGAASDWPQFRGLTLRALKLVTFVAAPVSAMLVALAPYAASVFSLSGLDLIKYTAASQILTTWALAIVPWGVNTLLLRSFYARQKQAAAVGVSAASFVAEVGLYFVLARPAALGLYGFGVASTMMGILTGAVLAWLSRREIGLSLRPLMGHLARVLPLGAVSGLAAWLITRPLPAPGEPLPGLLGLALGGLVGGAVYLVLALIFKVGEVNGLLSRLRR